MLSEEFFEAITRLSNISILADTSFLLAEPYESGCPLGLPARYKERKVLQKRETYALKRKSKNKLSF